MKKQLITTLLLTISAGAGNAMTSENIDSLSYAYGYQYTIATMAGKNDFMQSEQDFSDYIRGLQEYANGFNPATRYQENRQAYATGMADILEAYSEPPKSAYDMGRSISLSMRLTAVDNSSLPIDYRSFVAGAKASLGLGEQIIPRDEVEAIFNRQFEQQVDATGEIDYEVNFEKAREIIGKLEIEPFGEYRVDWKVTAGAVAEPGTSPTDIFGKVMSELNISDHILSGVLMTQMRDEDSRIYEAASAAIEKYSLPDGYKWFCGRNDDLQTTIGIMNTKSVFAADVRRASVELDTASGMVNVEWAFDADDAIKWAKFTEASIGRHVAVEIDSRFMFAPRVNQQITGGHCAISGLTSEEINLLFRNAEKDVNQHPADTIEVIEIN